MKVNVAVEVGPYRRQLLHRVLPETPEDIPKKPGRIDGGRDQTPNHGPSRTARLAVSSIPPGISDRLESTLMKLRAAASRLSLRNALAFIEESHDGTDYLSPYSDTEQVDNEYRVDWNGFLDGDSQMDRE